MYAGHETKKAFRRFAAPFIRDAPRYAALHPRRSVKQCARPFTEWKHGRRRRRRRKYASPCNEQRATSNEQPGAYRELLSSLRYTSVRTKFLTGWSLEREMRLRIRFPTGVQLIPIRLVYNAIIAAGMAGTSFDRILPRVTPLDWFRENPKILRSRQLFASPLHVIVQAPGKLNTCNYLPRSII